MSQEFDGRGSSVEASASASAASAKRKRCGEEDTEEVESQESQEEILEETFEKCSLDRNICDPENSSSSFSASAARGVGNTNGKTNNAGGINSGGDVQFHGQEKSNSKTDSGRGTSGAPLDCDPSGQETRGSKLIPATIYDERHRVGLRLILTVNSKEVEELRTGVGGRREEEEEESVEFDGKFGGDKNFDGGKNFDDAKRDVTSSLVTSSLVMKRDILSEMHGSKISMSKSSEQEEVISQMVGQKIKGSEDEVALSSQKASPGPSSDSNPPWSAASVAPEPVAGGRVDSGEWRKGGGAVERKTKLLKVNWS